MRKMDNGYLMALDAGGGGGHCLLVEVNKGEITRGFRSWTHPAAPGTDGLGSDLELDVIWTSLGEAARDAMTSAGATPDQVLGVAVTSMRFAIVVLDGKGKPLLAAPNRDGRAVIEGLELAAQLGSELYERTGHWPGPMFSASRLRWLATHHPTAWPSAASLLTLSDWVTYRLCGELGSDPSHASDTLLFDIEKRDWAWDLIERLDMPRGLFPPLRQSGSRIGSLTSEAAENLGLRAGTPVAVGGGDTQCGLLGAGAVAAGQAAAILGTSAPVQLVLDRPCIDRGQRLWTGLHVVPGAWVMESNSGLMGEALEWLARLLYPEAPHPTARFFAEAGLAKPGAAAILSTLGAGVMDAKELRLPSGTLTLSHLAAAQDSQPRHDLARAVIEGMACGLRANLEQIIEASGRRVPTLHLGGGMSRSDVFAQMISNVVNLPVQLSVTADTTALGAALCAGVGAGVFRDLTEAAQNLAGEVRTLRPADDQARACQDRYDGWQKLRAARAQADSMAEQILLPAVLDTAAACAAGRAPSFRPRILVTADMDEEGLAALRDLGEVEYASFRQAMRLLTGKALLEALQGFQVFVTEVDIVDVRALQNLPELRAIASCRSDAVNVDLAACTAFGVPVLNAPGRNAEAVADLTVAFLLMLARKLPAASGFLRQPGIEAGDVGRMGQAFTALQGRELWCKTVGLVGLGAVGRAVARRLAAFGASVIVCDPYVRSEQAALADAELVSLEEVLERSDFLSLHAAASGESSSLIGASELARMKPGAFLVNTARAALVDEDALADALRSGHLGGAAVDVFPVEPPPSDHPLLALDNVIATPHVGGNTVDVAAHQARIISDDLRRLLCGERPRHVLNPEVLTDFDWSKPRPQPDPEVIEQIAKRPAPAVSDLQRDRAASGKPAPQAKAAPAAPPAAVTAVPPEIAERMERLLRGFIDRVVADEALRKAAASKEVALHFTLTDLAQSFHFRLREGSLSGNLGDPDTPADVDLKMRAAIFDGMFTGTVNGMQAAMSGQLSFSGDTVKAMTLQELQEDLSRLYKQARDEVGGPGDLDSLPDPTAGATGAPLVRPIEPGDIREELIQVVNELYEAELITATGGNVSARVPGTDNEVWITPGQLFKGDLRHEILVRIDLDGRPLDPGSLSPSSERLMHCAVYRARPEAQAVVHAHAAHATILANAGLPFLPISTEAAFFGNIPRVPFIMPGTEELAKVVGEAARDSWAVLLQNHGLLVGGRTLRRAADMVEIIERSAEIILGCHAVGKEPPTLPEELVLALRRMGDIVA